MQVYMNRINKPKVNDESLLKHCSEETKEFARQQRRALWTAPAGVSQYVSTKSIRNLLDFPSFFSDHKYLLAKASRDDMENLLSYKPDEKNRKEISDNIRKLSTFIENAETEVGISGSAKNKKIHINNNVKKVVGHSLDSTFVDIFSYSCIAAVVLASKFKPYADIENSYFFLKNMKKEYKVKEGFDVLIEYKKDSGGIVNKKRLSSHLYEHANEFNDALNNIGVDWDSSDEDIDDIREFVYEELKKNTSMADPVMGLCLDFPYEDSKFLYDKGISPVDNRKLNEKQRKNLSDEEVNPVIVRDMIEYINTPLPEIVKDLPEGKYIRPAVLVRSLWTRDLGRAYDFIKKSVQADTEVKLATKYCGIEGRNYEEDIFKVIFGTIFDLEKPMPSGSASADNRKNRQDDT